MELKILGMKVRVELLVLLLVVGMIMGAHLFGSCAQVSLKEGMAMMGAELGYKMGEGVHGSWDGREQQQGASVAWRQQNHDAYESQHVGPDKAMHFFADTDFAPECCGATYSANGGLNASGFSSGGCACMSKQQLNYLNERGGNRTQTSEF
jgi:hypothetical protein